MESTVYYQDPQVVIRSMLPGDIQQLANGFAAQGWHKPPEQFAHYLQLQQEGSRKIIIAEHRGQAVGYTTLLPLALEGPFAGKLPEIQDFNVLISHRRQGFGNRILDAAEALAKGYGLGLAPGESRASIGVGLHPGYGNAQRLYVKRGYIPDGSGVWYQDRPLPAGAPCANDDELVLYLSKTL